MSFADNLMELRKLNNLSQEKISGYLINGRTKKWKSSELRRMTE